MRQLHVLGVSDDGGTLLLGPTKSGKPSHRIPLDERLRAVVRGQLSAVATSDRTEIALSPKEIQARLRAGETPEEVAKAAQVPVARVIPYAAPVLAERERIVEQARAALLHRSRGPNGSHPMGEVVDGNLSEVAGLKTETVEWTARRRRDGAWVVLLSYSARGGRRTASWLWRAVERDLTTLDAAASRLAAEESAAPKRRTAKKPAAKRPAAKRPAAKKAAKKAKPAAKRTAAKRTTVKRAAKPAARKAPARKAVTRTSARTAATRKAAAPRTARPAGERAAAKAKVTVRKQAARKPVLVKPAAAKPRLVKPAPARQTARKPVLVKPAPEPARKRASRVVAAESQPTAPVVRIVPDAVDIPTPAEQTAAAAGGRRGRVSVPSWSEVLLGVQSVPRDSGDDGGPARRRRKS